MAPAKVAGNRSRATKSSGRRTQAERTARSEERLLRAALQLIGDRGYERTTLAAIGMKAGYSRGLGSHRYGSKERLLGAIIVRFLDRWDADNVAPLVENRVGVDALCATLDAVLAETRKRPAEFRALIAILFDPNPALRARVAGLHDDLRLTIRKMLEQGIAAAAIHPDVDLAAHAALFVGAMQGTLYHWAIAPKSVDIEASFAALKWQMRAALQARGEE